MFKKATKTIARVGTAVVKVEFTITIHSVCLQPNPYMKELHAGSSVQVIFERGSKVSSTKDKVIIYF